MEMAEGTPDQGSSELKAKLGQAGQWPCSSGGGGGRGLGAQGPERHLHGKGE